MTTPFMGPLSLSTTVNRMAASVLVGFSLARFAASALVASSELCSAKPLLSRMTCFSAPGAGSAPDTTRLPATTKAIAVPRNTRRMFMFELPRSATASCRPSGRFDARGDDGDVVQAAVLVGQADQLLADAVQILARAGDLGDLLVSHHARQAVGAQDVDVAQAGRVDVDVDLHGVPHAQRPHDDVLVRERLDLRRAPVLHLDVVVQQRVVLGQLLELF